jgi:hypothetical protein
MPVPKVPPRSALKTIFDDEQICFDFLANEGILTLTTLCICGNTLHYNAGRNDLRCSSSLCRSARSVFKGTFFQKSRLPLNHIMELAY